MIFTTPPFLFRSTPPPPRINLKSGIDVPHSKWVLDAESKERQQRSLIVFRFCLEHIKSCTNVNQINNLIRFADRECINQHVHALCIAGERRIEFVDNQNILAIFAD